VTSWTSASYAGGSLLDFFLIADGANGGKNVYSTERVEQS
jgi:hypothetical protein